MVWPPARRPIGPRASGDVEVRDGCRDAQRKRRGARTATRDAPEELAKVLEAWRCPRVQVRAGMELMNLLSPKAMPSGETRRKSKGFAVELKIGL